MSGWPQYFQKMRGVLWKRVRRREEIEDLMQDAAVRLLEYCEQGGQVQQPEALLVRTVQRLAINRVRDGHADLYVEDRVEDLEVVDLSPGPDEVLSGQQYLEQMQQALDAVSRRTRDIFFMHRLHGFSYAQIARLANMPVSTVEKHIARAMTVLLEKRRGEMLQP
jgi:RNA polymerase sigma factor (sigma-70 family)